MFRMIQEAFTKLSMEEANAISIKTKNEHDLQNQNLKAVMQEEYNNNKQSIDEIISKLKIQISDKEKEIQTLKKVNKKLEKRNKNLKETAEKLDKNKIEELNKIIEEQKEKINDYEKQIETLKNLPTIEEEKDTPENKMHSSTNSYANNKICNAKLEESKQVKFLISKNHELRAELDRRTRISDQMKKEHEAALRDRNELLAEVKTLKSQVDEVKSRLDRSIALISKKRRFNGENIEKVSTGEGSSYQERRTQKATIMKSTQTTQAKASVKSTSTHIPIRKPGNGRLILNSIARGSETSTTKRQRVGILRKATENKDSTDSPESKEVENKEASEVSESQSLQDVKTKRVVSDMKSKLEKKQDKQDKPSKSSLSTTSSKSNQAPVEREKDMKFDSIMELFEVVDENDEEPSRNV